MINDVPLTCINHAAIQYHVPATMIISILKIENGRVGQANLNKDGSFDYGPMQINSRFLFQHHSQHYSVYDLQYDACKNVSVGTWMLAQAIANDKHFWAGVGNYHSHTVYYNTQYQLKIKAEYNHITQLLNRF